MDYLELSKSLRGKRIFLTGHTGFKGSWLTCLLNYFGANVAGYSLPANKHSLFNILDIKNQTLHIEGDIRSYDKLSSAINSFQPDIVFHLAAQALVHESYRDPVMTISTNVCGSMNVLEAVRNCSSVKSLIYVTSDKCYENLEWVWGYRENDRLGGRDPYSASKAAAEIIFSSYSESFYLTRNGFGAASVRAGNVIGGGDWSKDRVIPDCIRSIQGESIIRLRNPSSTRPWQHVLEPLSGYLILGLKLLDNNDLSGSWNFGPSSNDRKTVLDVAKYVLQEFDRNPEENIEIQAQHGMHEAKLLQLNCDKASSQLGWLPRWNSDQSLFETVNWYKAFISGKDMHEVTNNQIKKYFNIYD